MEKPLRTQLPATGFLRADFVRSGLCNALTTRLDGDDRRLVSGKKGLARVANSFIQPSETTTFLLDHYLTCLMKPPLQPLDMGDYVVPVSSPLDTLARQTSSRRSPNPVQTTVSQAGSGEDAQYAHVPVLGAPPKRHVGPAPHSPLLHTRFRTSTATQSSINTSNELYGPTMANGSEDFPYDDDVSIYSTGMSSDSTLGRLSNSVRRPAQLEQISELSGTVQDRSTPSPQPRDGTSGSNDGHRPKNGMLDMDNNPGPRSNKSVTLPIVVISSEEPEGVVNEPGQGFGDVLSSPIAESQSVGHRPSSSGGTQSNYLNFSRPMKASNASEDTKRQVLARNAFRGRSPPSAQSPQPSAGASPPLSRQISPAISPSNDRQHVPENPLNSFMSSSNRPSSLVPTRPAPKPPVATSTQIIPLLHEPPRVSSSPTSLYSKFSYYELDSPSSSPTSDSLQVPASPHTPPQRAGSPLTQGPTPRDDSQQPDLADQLLQEGIRHHEENRLREAAIAFERSARTPGGSGVGMLMWGLTLRHGWGCAKDETLGFSWLRRAAEAAVGDLERARAGLDMSAVRGELVLAIYEVGQCFFQGWGVKKDQKMAVVSGLFYSYMCLCCAYDLRLL
jgi:hypothetical protein